VPKKSAGILLYRRSGKQPEVFLVHPGGPFYAKKDAGVWSIPKGEFEEGTQEAAALREFHEETGVQLDGPLHFLADIKMKSGKIVYCWAKEGDLDETLLASNLFEIEWPPRSGKMRSFPEMDRGGWFTPDAAREKILPAQLPFIDALEKYLKASA
jgi:predicted NUDIX family NTP pyrophosphohydrolase